MDHPAALVTESTTGNTPSVQIICLPSQWTASSLGKHQLITCGIYQIPEGDPERSKHFAVPLLCGSRMYKGAVIRTESMADIDFSCLRSIYAPDTPMGQYIRSGLPAPLTRDLWELRSFHTHLQVSHGILRMSRSMTRSTRGLQLSRSKPVTAAKLGGHGGLSSRISPLQCRA